MLKNCRPLLLSLALALGLWAHAGPADATPAGPGERLPLAGERVWIALVPPPIAQPDIDEFVSRLSEVLVGAGGRRASWARDVFQMCELRKARKVAADVAVEFFQPAEGRLSVALYDLTAEGCPELPGGSRKFPVDESGLVKVRDFIVDTLGRGPKR